MKIEFRSVAACAMLLMTSHFAFAQNETEASENASPEMSVDGVESKEAAENAGTSGQHLDNSPSPPPENSASRDVDVIPVPNVVSQDETPLQPQSPSDQTQLGDIEVTAQKRVQTVQQVPISITVMNEAFIKSQGITDVGEALLFAPNFSVEETATSITPKCRGFVVEDQNPAFESPCGIAIDSVAYTRAFYFASSLFDTQRLEVLRGPQGTVFGKNTTAGVISVITKDPSPDFTADLDLQYGDFGRRRGEFGIGGTLIPDVVDFRVAGMREERDGFMKNTVHEIDPSVPEYGGGRDRTAGRIKLNFVDVFGTQVKLTYEAAKLAFVGTSGEAFFQGSEEDSKVDDYYRQFDPNANFNSGDFINSVAGNSTGTTESNRSQIDWSFALGDWDWTLVGAKGKLSNSASGEVTGSPQKSIFSQTTEDSPFETIELRTVSPDIEGFLGLKSFFGIDLGKTTLLGGLFYQDQTLDTSLTVNTLYVPVVGLIAAGSGVVLPLDQLSLLAISTFGNDVGEMAWVTFKQNTLTRAAYTQLTWNFTEEWLLEAGVRYSEEVKKAHWDTSYSLGAALLDPTGERGFVADREIMDRNVLPKVTLGFAPTRQLNFFAHWTKGFKSGGFNAYTIAGNPEETTILRPERTGSLSFNPETAEEWGIDAKMDLFDRRMRLNLSLYQLTVEDFQVLTTVFGDKPAGDVTDTRLPNGYDEVRNAASARAQGAELDLTYMPWGWLTTIAGIGYNKTEYLDFENGTCPGDVATESGYCDQSGKPFAYAPELSGAFTVQTRFPLGALWSAFGSTEFLVGGTVEYSGDFYQNPTLDDRYKQEAYYRYRANVGFANDPQGWSFRVIGTNLTNEYIYGRLSSDDGNFAGGTPQAGREVFAQFVWNIR